MTPAPTGRTGDGYPGRGVPPRPDRPQGPPRSGEVPRPRHPQEPRQGPAPDPRTPWDDYSDRQPGQGRDPRADRQRDPRDPGYQQRDPRDQGQQRRDPSYQPRQQNPQNGYPQPAGRQQRNSYPQQAPSHQQAPGRRQDPSFQQNPSFQRVDRATGEIRSLDETHIPRGTRRRVPQNPEDLRPDEFSSSFQDRPDRYDEEGADPDGDLLESEQGDRGGRGRRRAGSRRKDRLTPAQRRRRKVIFRTVAGIMAVFVFLTSYSLYGALSAPGNMSNQARVAEWARGHGMGWAVSWMENQQYQNNKPKTGGGLSAQQLADLAPPTATPTLAPKEKLLSPMKPFVPNPAPGEGDWSPAVVVNGVPVIQTAKLRSDPQHLEYLSAVAWMDQKHASFVLHPGSQQPGTDGYNQTDHLSGDQLKNLIATWNGAFLLRNPNDAHGGFYLNGKTYGTLVPGAASEVFYKDGTMNVGTWNSGPGLQMDPNVVGVRQNLQLLVDNGQINPQVNSDDKKLWGVTIKNAYFVWRSGIGITADGDIVYAMGPALSVPTLAELLQRAGAVRGMELDINPEWVSYMTYDGSKNPASPISTKLLDFARTGQRYFSTEERDFVAVYSR